MIGSDGRRSLEQVLADLLTKHQLTPAPGLARKIELIQAEIELRKRPKTPAD